MIIGVQSQNSTKLLVGRVFTFEELQILTAKLHAVSDINAFAGAFCAATGCKELSYSEGYADYRIDLDEQIVSVTPHTFPAAVGGANVCFFTEKGTFSPVCSAGGEPMHKVYYQAICRYEDDGDFYVLSLDHNLNVVADGCCGDRKACRQYMDESDAVWHTRRE